MDGEQEQLLPLSEMEKVSTYRCSQHPQKVSLVRNSFQYPFIFKKVKNIHFIV